MNSTLSDELDHNRVDASKHKVRPRRASSSDARAG